MRAAHRDHYLALAETAAPHLIGPGQIEWLDRLELEFDNLRSAISYSLQDPNPVPGQRLGRALCYFWLYRKPRAEGAVALLPLTARMLRSPRFCAAARLLPQASCSR